MKNVGLKKAKLINTAQRKESDRPTETFAQPSEAKAKDENHRIEALRHRIEALFEPEFKQFENANQFMCTNFGFRPEIGAWEAVENIKIKGRRTTYVIEGNIQQAYNQVNHRKLMQILRRKITDEAFLEAVYNLLKSTFAQPSEAKAKGAIKKDGYVHSLTGIPKANRVSQLLFNVYMFENDKQIYETIIKPRIKKEKTRSNPEYSRLIYELATFAQPSEAKAKEIKKLFCPTFGGKKGTIIDKRTRTKGIKAVQKKLFRIPSQKINSLRKDIYYCRYGNQWVLLLTGPRIKAENLLTHTTALLKNLNLSLSKTKMTRLDEGFSWLGFSIKMNHNKQIKIAKVLRKKTNGSMERVLKRVNTRAITIYPDKHRLMNHLINQGFCKNNGMPIAKASWTVLNNYEIVKNYAQIIQDLYEYYASCDNKKILNRVQYILKYSCAKTLARRKKTSVRKVFKNYGENMQMTKYVRTGKERSRVNEAKAWEGLSLKIQYPNNDKLCLIKRKRGAETDSDPFYPKFFFQKGSSFSKQAIKAEQIKEIKTMSK